MTIKTTVYLVEDDLRRLKAIARRHKCSVTQLIRKAVASYVRSGLKTRPRSLGAGRSGGRDVGERAQELLRGIGKR